MFDKKNLPWSQFDPSQMDPSLLLKLSGLFQKLPAQQLQRMQGIAHNLMAGHNVETEMQALSETLPPDLQKEIFAIMSSMGMQVDSSLEEVITLEPASQQAPLEVVSTPMSDLREARLTVLRAVASAQVSPEEALALLYPEEADKTD